MAQLHGMRCCAIADLRCNNTSTLTELRDAIERNCDTVNPHHPSLLAEDITTIQAITLSRGETELAKKLKKLGFRKIATVARRPELVDNGDYFEPTAKNLHLWHLRLPLKRVA